MDKTRKNTLKIVFANGAKIPLHLDVLKFTAQVLKIPAPDVHSIYRDENDRCFYIKFIDEPTFNEFTGRIDDQYRFKYNDGEGTTVKLEVASRLFRYVRIFNLPPELEDKDIAAVLSQFGTIRQHVRERYPTDYGYAVFSGVRGVHMEIAKELPPNLFIGHFKARLYYDGLKNRCFFCKMEGHVKANCPKAASTKTSAAPGSYSGVVAGAIVNNLADLSLPMTLTPLTLKPKDTPFPDLSREISPTPIGPFLNNNDNNEDKTDDIRMENDEAADANVVVEAGTSLLKPPQLPPADQAGGERKPRAPERKQDGVLAELENRSRSRSRIEVPGKEGGKGGKGGRGRKPKSK